MTTENTNETVEQDGEQEQATEEKPKKILLGRRVIRQLSVKSGLQTGEPAYRCTKSVPPA